MLFAACGLIQSARAQTSTYSIPFTSGPIPLCDTVTFTANVSGVGLLTTPSMWTYSAWIQSLTINVTSDHPQGLSISLTSPQIGRAHV